VHGVQKSCREHIQNTKQTESNETRHCSYKAPSTKHHINKKIIFHTFCTTLHFGTLIFDPYAELSAAFTVILLRKRYSAFLYKVLGVSETRQGKTQHAQCTKIVCFLTSIFNRDSENFMFFWTFDTLQYTMQINSAYQHILLILKIKIEIL